MHEDTVIERLEAIHKRWGVPLGPELSAHVRENAKRILQKGYPDSVIEERLRQTEAMIAGSLAAATMVPIEHSCEAVSKALELATKTGFAGAMMNAGSRARQAGALGLADELEGLAARALDDGSKIMDEDTEKRRRLS